MFCVCGNVMNFRGYCIFVKDVDLNGEPFAFGVSEVYVCEGCKIGKMESLDETFDSYKEALEYIKCELNGNVFEDNSYAFLP